MGRFPLVCRQFHSGYRKFSSLIIDRFLPNNNICHPCQSQKRFGHQRHGGKLNGVTSKRDWNNVKLNRTKKSYYGKRNESYDKKNEYVFGVAPCLAALQAGRRQVFEIYIREAGAQNTERPEFESIKKLAKQKRIPILPASRQQLMKLSEGRPAQNIVIKATPLQFEREDSQNNGRKLQECQSQKSSPVWLALDEIQDPMNFGAVLRTSAFLGVDRVVVPRDNSAPLSPVVSKASAGAMETMQVACTTNLVAFLEEKASEGWDIVGAVQPENKEGAQSRSIVDCEDHTISKPTLIVLGNEGVGLRSTIQNQCTRFIAIFPPTDTRVVAGLESLNVSVAAGILLYSVLKKRKSVS